MADHTKPESAAILPAKTWAGVVDEEDAKSIRSEAESSTASLTASIFEYRTLHGRTYHSDRGGSQYWGTNDERQNESLDINHHACTLLLGGKLHLAPLEEEKVKNALDVGTGTGNWAMDFASEYPSAQVIGTDLSPVQPTWIPPNLTFQIDDFNLEWTFAPNHFDYIHTRWLVGTSADWNKFYSQAFHHLAPGGWFETHEMSAIIESDDGSVTPTSALGQWGSIFISGGQEMGIPFTIIQDGTQKKGMEAAGFVDIQEKNFKMPIGDWPRDPDMKEIGLFSRAVLEGDPEGYVLFMTHSLGWSRDEILAYIQAVRKQVRGRKSRPFYRQRVVWGRKPE